MDDERDPEEESDEGVEEASRALWEATAADARSQRERRDRAVLAVRASGYVLLAEDDQLLARSLAREIRAEIGCVVVSTGEQACMIIEQRREGLRGAVVDLNLASELSGLDVLRRLRDASGPGGAIPAILMTGHPDDRARTEALRRRVRYVNKLEVHSKLGAMIRGFCVLASTPTSTWRSVIDQLALRCGLTPTHRRILELRIVGIPRDDLHDVLGVARCTIDRHLDEMRARVGVAKSEDLFVELARAACHASASSGGVS